MVPLIRRFTGPGKRVFEDDAVLELGGVEQSPAAGVFALPARFLTLVGQQLRLAIADAVIVRLRDPDGAVIPESQQALVGDGESELRVEGSGKRDDLVHARASSFFASSQRRTQLLL